MKEEKDEMNIYVVIKMDDKEKEIFSDYLNKHKECCYCSLNKGMCDNCIAKEHLFELWKLLNKDKELK